MTNKNELLKGRIFLIPCSNTSYKQTFTNPWLSCKHIFFCWSMNELFGSTTKSQTMWQIREAPVLLTAVLQKFHTLLYTAGLLSKTRSWQLTLVTHQPCRRENICFWQRPCLSSALPAARQLPSKTARQKMHQNQSPASQSTGDPCRWAICSLTESHQRDRSNIISNIFTIKTYWFLILSSITYCL